MYLVTLRKNKNLFIFLFWGERNKWTIVYSLLYSDDRWSRRSRYTGISRRMNIGMVWYIHTRIIDASITCLYVYVLIHLNIYVYLYIFYIYMSYVCVCVCSKMLTVIFYHGKIPIELEEIFIRAPSLYLIPFNVTHNVLPIILLY